MRNVFDQYSQPENRITHALATVLHEDPPLLRAFLKEVAKVEPRGGDDLRVHQQTYPGSLDSEPTEGETERKGIPDAWITCGEDWCLLIENKVLIRATSDQLGRHLATARRLGFTDVHALVLTVGNLMGNLPKGVQVVEWTWLYGWLRRKAKAHPWAQRMAEYLEVMEAKLAQQEQLVSGTLTTFTGVPFGDELPFTYAEAKRVLGLMRAELSKRTDLQRKLGMRPEVPGRPKITGQGGDSVWDYLGLEGAQEDFNKSPHLTFALLRLSVEALLTVPHSVKPASRRRLVGLGRDGFADLIRKVVDRMEPVIAKCDGIEPRVRLMQRHWPTRSSPPILDALLIFDPRTAFDGDGPLKAQPEWLDAAFASLCNKKSNLQFQVGAYFPYASCDVTRSREILDRMAAVWIACEPVLEVLNGQGAPA